MGGFVDGAGSGDIVVAGGGGVSGGGVGGGGGGEGKRFYGSMAPIFR